MSDYLTLAARLETKQRMVAPDKRCVRQRCVDCSVALNGSEGEHGQHCAFRLCVEAAAAIRTLVRALERNAERARRLHSVLGGRMFISDLQTPADKTALAQAEAEIAAIFQELAALRRYGVCRSCGETTEAGPHAKHNSGCPECRRSHPGPDQEVKT